jgi:hypothetical protein
MGWGELLWAGDAIEISGFLANKIAPAFDSAVALWQGARRFI